jgi:hypothetical protein
MSYIANEGIAPTIQLNSVGIGFQLDSDGSAINVDTLDLNTEEFLVVGERTYIPEESHQRNTKWNLVVNTEGVAVNTSRNVASNFLSRDTSLYVDKNIHCSGIIKAAGLELSNITIRDGDPLTSSLIREFIVSANQINVNQPFQTGLITNVEDVYTNMYDVKNIFTPNYVTFGGYVDTYKNTHPLNIVSTVNNKFNSMQIAIRNDVNNIDNESSKFCMGIIGGSNKSPAIISTTRGVPLEFHVSKSSEAIDNLYGTSALPNYTNSNSNYLPAMTIDENNNVAIGKNKTNYIEFNRKTYNGCNVIDNEISQEHTRLEVAGISSFNDILMYDYFTKTHKHLDDIYIRSSGISAMNATQIKGGNFVDINYKFNSNLEVTDLFKTKNININSNANISNNLTTKTLTVNDSSLFKGEVNFDNDVSFVNTQQININKLKVVNDMYIGDKRIIPIDIDDPSTGYGTYSRSEDGSNYFFVYVHSNIATLDANCNISFPKKMALGLTQSDGFDGVLNIIKHDATTSNNFDIFLKNTIADKSYIANIGRLSRLDYNDNSLIINTNKVHGKNNNIYFYPSSDISELTSNYYLPNIQNTPPILSLKKTGVGINKLSSRNGYELDVNGNIVANDYYVSVDNVAQRAKNFVYQNKNFFNLYDSVSDKYCVNYNNLTAFESDMRGFNVKKGLNADLYYQNNNLIETLQIANDAKSFYTNKKISIGWNGEEVTAPLQVRNIALNDYNYSTIRIYRGARGGGAKNNADYSGIDICEYDRNFDQDRNKERWFIYKNHKYNDIDSRNVNRIGPLQIGYTDKTTEPTSYGMSFYYDTLSSNYHIDVNKPEVSYDSKSAMSIYGDLDVHGNINIIDKAGCNFNFNLASVSSQLNEVKTYINLIQSYQEDGSYANSQDEIIMSFDIIRPNKQLTIDAVSNDSIPLIVKQDNSNYSVAKFITYSDNQSNCTSSIELGIYNSNLFLTDDNQELQNNLKNMIEFKVSNKERDTVLGLSYYNNSAYKNFINFKNNVGENGDIISTNTHIGIGNNLYNSSNITLHIDDNEKYGLQITNNQYPAAINLLSTKGTCNIYHTITGGDFENKYKFNIDIANSSSNNIPDSRSVFTIDAFQMNGDMRRGSRFGFNSEEPEDTLSINTDYDTSAMSLTSRYSREYIFESEVDIDISSVQLNLLSSNWNDIDNIYESSYSYDVIIASDTDNNNNVILEEDKSNSNFFFRSVVPVKNLLSYKTVHSNLDASYYSSNLSVDYSIANIFASTYYGDRIPSHSNTFISDFNITPPDKSYSCNVITYDDIGTKMHRIQYNFTSNLGFIENISCNYEFVYKYENTYTLPNYINCNISIETDYTSNYTSNFEDTSNFINIKNVVYTDFLPFDIETPYIQYMYDDIYTGKYVDNTAYYSNIFIISDTSNILRYNSNLLYDSKVTSEHTNDITFISSNYMVDNFKNIEEETNFITLSYDITLVNDVSNINISSSNFVLNNFANNQARYMILENVNSNVVLDDVFDILGNTITNKININEFQNNYSNYQLEQYTIKIKNYNSKKYKPHFRLINNVESIGYDSGHDVYSYDGIFEIKYSDGIQGRSFIPLRIDELGNTTIQGGLDMKGDLSFNGHIYDANGNDLIEILNKNYYKEYEINSSNINFNSLGSNGVEINAYASCNYDDFKFFYAKDYMSNNIIEDVMILHKINSNETKYKLDLYGDIDTSNGILRVEGRDIIRDTCNYILDTSNVISTRITNLITDEITEELISSNKFIVNHIYDNNLTVTGDLYIHSNLIVSGDTTRLDTTLFRAEVLELVNEIGLDIALNIIQKPSDVDIIRAYNNNKQVFTLANDGSMGLGVSEPAGTLFNIKQTNTSQDIIKASNSNKEVFTLANDGSIGLGVNDPDGILFNIKQSSNNKDIIRASNSNKQVFALANDGSLGLGVSDPGGVLFNIKQSSNNLDIIRASNSNKQVFTLANDGSMGLGVSEPGGILFNIKQSSNNLDIIRAANSNKQVFTLANDGSLGLGVSNPGGILFNIKQSSNNIDIIRAANSNKQVFTLANDGSLGLGVSEPGGVLFNIKQSSNNLDIIRAANSNKQVFTLANDGSLGLGVSNPGGILFNIKQTCNIFDIINASNNVKEVFTLANDGSLGLGVSEPGGILFNIKQSSNNIDIIRAANSNKQVFTLANDGSLGLGVSNPGGVLFNIKQTSNSFDIINASNNVKEVFTLTNNGSLGLGVSEPGGILFNIKQSSNNIDIIRAANSNKQVFTLANDGSLGLGVSEPGGILFNIKQTSNSFDIINASNNVKEVFTLANDGSLGLGVSEPGGILFNIKQSSNNIDIIRAANSNKQVFTLANDGSVGLGVSNPAGVLFNIRQTCNIFDIINASNNVKEVFTLANDGSLGLGVSEPGGILFNIKQSSNNIDIIRAANSNKQVFTLANDGSMGLGVSNPAGVLFNIKQTCNIFDIINASNNVKEVFTLANDGSLGLGVNEPVGVLFNIKQSSNNIDIIRAANSNKQVFTLANDGSMGLGVSNPAGVLFNIKQTCNIFDIINASNNVKEVFTLANDGSLGLGVNEPGGVLFNIRQSSNNIDIIRASNSNKQVFTLANDGSLGLGVSNPGGVLFNIKQTSNSFDIINASNNVKEVFTLANDGSLGLGVSEPGGVLFNIKQSSNNIDIIRAANSNKQVFTLANDGSLGLGVSNPGGVLFNIKQTCNIFDIINASNNVKEVFTLANDGSLGLGVSEPGGVLFNIKQSSNNIDIIRAANSNKQVFTLANDGSLGLGVSNPAGVLFNIKQTCNIFDIINASNNVKEVFTLANDGSLGLGINEPGGVLFNIKQSSNNIDIIRAANSNKQVFTLANDGSVGLGVNDPSGVSLNIRQSNNTDIIRASNNSGVLLTLTNSGILGLGVQSPNGNSKLDVNGNVNIVNTGSDNFKYTIDGRDIIGETSNYILNASNLISTRIKNLTTDQITENLISSNKFIVNHNYNNNLSVNGDLYVYSNLIVGGDTTRLDTTVFTTEILEIINESGDDVALKVTQKAVGIDIFKAYNNTKEVFTITSNGLIGINTNIPSCSLHVNTTDSIKLPKGDTLQRPQNLTVTDSGLIRYNTETQQFEGFGAGEAWGSLGGVIDIAQNTFVRAEREAGLGNNELEFYTNSNERMIIKEDGRVGIGISAPDYIFDVKGIIRTSSNLYVDNRVGIGTNAPFCSLDVNATDSIKLPKGDTLQRPQNLTITDSGLIRYNTETQQFEGFGAGEAWGSLGGVIDIAQNTFVRAEREAGLGNNELEFYTNSNERMIIKDDGKVGIGISAPAYILDVKGDIRTSSNLYVDSKIGIGTNAPFCSLDVNATDSIKLPKGDTLQRPQNLTVTDSGLIRYNTETQQFEGFGAGEAWGSLGGVIDIAQNTFVRAEREAGLGNNELEFYTNSNERMIIKDDGKVGIGISAPGYILDVKGDIRTSSNLYVDSKIGIGTKNPSALLSLYGDRADFKIQDSRIIGDMTTSFELINGSNSSYKNNSNCGWRLANSNNQFLISSGKNGVSVDKFIIDGITGNVGIGTKPHIYDAGFDQDEFKINILGSINIEGDIYKDGTLFSGSSGTGGTGGGSVGVIAQNMPVQTLSETYTQTRVMSENISTASVVDGWNFIDEDILNGFVIKIKPSQRKSKILLTLNTHIGFDSSKDSRWWGLKLYRKVVGDSTKSSDWVEVIDANGADNADATSCWLSHNLGANLTSYENSVANISGSFFDSPDTRYPVYYTVKWKSRLGDNNVNANLYTPSGDLYLNRPAKYNSKNSPTLSSTWVATEIWQLGTPFIPSEGVNIITIYNQDYVGIANTLPVYPLDVNGDIRAADNIYIDNKVGIGTYEPFCSLHVNTTDCIKLPRGITSQRPQGLVESDSGLIRYNTETQQFEGFGAGEAWGSLGGVIDVAQRTFVRAEREAGLGNNELEFYTNSNERMIIKDDGKVGIGISAPVYTFDVNGDIRTASNLYVDSKIGVGTKNPSALLSLSGDRADFKIQDSRNTGDITTSIELINGSSNSYKNNSVCGWLMANSNNQYVVSSGINSVISDRLTIDGISGNIGIGQNAPNYKLDINGPINAQAFNINGSPFVLEFSQGMTIQTLHKTYTKTSSKSDTETDWVAIDYGNGGSGGDGSDGFVIKITPSHIQSKVLVSLTCHIGMDYLQDSRWWGLRLYRKIGIDGTWEPVMGANGIGNGNQNSSGTSCWISHNMGADSSTYSHFITNVTGSYQDMPNTTSDVYYTAFWKSKLDGTTGKLYLNKAAVDDVNANYPLPSSSWTATEIWNNGTPYTPTTTAIAIAHEKVGIGMTPTENSIYKLEVNGKINCESINSYSDARYKKNIEVIEPVLEFVNKINSVSYNMKNQNDTDIGNKSYGFIAQELEQLFPNVVSKPLSDNDYYSINYLAMIPILTKSIQELSDKVETQQVIINELISKLR